MLDWNLKDLTDCWIKSAPLKNVNLEEVHNYIFMLVSKNCFVTYEYVEGRATDLFSIDLNFFKELTTFVHLNDLKEIIRLQIHISATENMIKFNFNECETVMLNTHDTDHDMSFRTTGWVFDCSNDVISYKSNKAHALTIQSPHKVFINRKLVSDVKTLKSILRSYKVIS